MSPLGFVNWRQMSTWFCLAMWLLVLVLVVIILGHVASDAPAAHTAASPMLR
jgi:hypothetical protein